MIAFTVSLTLNDWDKAIGGWRCPVLQIPGAVVEGLYAGAKIDTLRYEVVPDQRFIRWGGRGEAPPESAALAIKLTEPLAPKKSRDFWKGIGIIVPVLVAIVTSIGGYQTAKVKGEPAALPTATNAKPGGGASTVMAAFSPEHFYEKWTVNGRINVKGGEANPFHIQAKIFPPEIPLSPMGKFSSLIPVANNGNNLRTFPSITFESRLPGYAPVTVELSDEHGAKAGKPGASQPAGTGYAVADYEQSFDYENKQITIGKTIDVVKQDTPYLADAAGSGAKPRRPAGAAASHP